MNTPACCAGSCRAGKYCARCAHAAGSHLTLRAGTSPSSSSRKMMEGADAAACRKHIQAQQCHHSTRCAAGFATIRPTSTPLSWPLPVILAGKARLGVRLPRMLWSAQLKRQASAPTDKPTDRTTSSPSQRACAGAAQRRLHTFPGSPCPCAQTGQRAWARGCCRCCCCLAQLPVLHTQQPAHAQGPSCLCLVVHAARCPCSTAAMKQQQVHTPDVHHLFVRKRAVTPKTTFVHQDLCLACAEHSPTPLKTLQKPATSSSCRSLLT
jgi:hypothetical protein